MQVVKVVCCLVGIIILILLIGFFGPIVSKHFIYGKEPAPIIKSATPVLDKFHKDVEKVLKDKK